MNIYVCIKQVPDTEAVLQVKDGNRINEDNIKWIISPYDEHAIEEALKFKTEGGGIMVKVISVGPNRVESALRHALAMGCDGAIHIETEELPDHKTIARALANTIAKDSDLSGIFTGKQAIDDDSYLVPIYLAEYLGIPVATNVVAFQFDWDTDKKHVVVEREIDEGARERIKMQIPCVVAAAKGLNKPRYVALIGILKAKKAEIKKYSLEDLGISGIKTKIRTEKLFAPPEKPQGKIISGEPEVAVKELLKLLKEEARVI